ncbi:universal stress protein [Sedimenticola selenatireducens]|uniref:Universal stress protein n=1 Tax=Sedimenticola selenatireducens TaxID=191960 RepID=A0A2N6CW76_9GAMM|nr:universal stress protein [Sedimenticola selenatireducens]PLX61511.1 MAG: universal stress protein [Sedimenticola selenatireducens]
MLPEVNTILYASDMGQNMRPAFRFAVSLAIKYHSKIVMIHALEPMGSTSRAMMENYLDADQRRRLQQEGYEYVRQDMKKRLADFFEDERAAIAGESGSPEVEVVVVTGQPAQVIVEEAQKRDAGLIVMGVHTDHSFGHKLMGSTTRKVIHNSSIPVMVVPVSPGG